MNKNSRIQYRRILTILLIVCLSLPTTALGIPIGGKGKKNFKEGVKYETAQQWDLAAQEFAAAVAAEPGNAEYRLHLLRSMQNAALMYMKRGDELMQQNDAAGAYNAYRQVAAYDPTNELATTKMNVIIEQQKAVATGARPIKVNAIGNDVGDKNVIETDSKPQRPGEITQNIIFRDSGFKGIVGNLANQLGLNIIMDESVKDPKISLQLQNSTPARALDNLLMMTKHTFEVVDRRTIFIYQDNPTNRQRNERLFVKTFYLGNTNPDDVRNAVQQMLPGQTKQALSLPKQNAMLVRASLSDLETVQQIINTLDKSKPEVVLDIEIYEVSNDTALQIGNQLATNTPLTIREATGEKDKDGNPVYRDRPSATLSNLGGVGLGKLGFAVLSGATTTPVLGGLGTILGLPPSSLSLLQSKGNNKVLARTQIHALDNEPNETKVGKKVPISLGVQNPSFIGGGVPGTTGVPGTGGVASGVNNAFGGFNNFNSFSSIQYQDVGLVIKATPVILNDGTVQVKMDLTSSGIEQSSQGGSDLTPIITQSSLTTVARIPDGKTSVVAGVQRQSDGNTRTTIPVIGLVPILGRFFTAPKQTTLNSDIVITITPHIIRSAAINRKDHLAYYVGSLGASTNLRVEDVINRAQDEEEQERRMIAVQSRPQVEMASTDPQGSALIKATTSPEYNPKPSAERFDGAIPTPTQQVASNGLTQPQRIDPVVQPIRIPEQVRTPTPAPTPAIATPNNRATSQNASMPVQSPAGTGATRPAFVSQSGSTPGGNTQELPDDQQQYVPQPPPPGVKPAQIRPAVKPENYEKVMKEEAEKATARSKEANPKQTQAEQDALIQQYIKEIPKAPEGVKPAAIRSTEKEKSKAKPEATPAGEKPANNKPADKPEQSEPAGATSETLVELNMMPATIKSQTGKSFIVVMSLDGNSMINAANLALKYDPAMLQVKAVRDGGLLGKRPDITHQVDHGTLMISMQQASGKETPVRASGRLLIVEFTALASGQTTIDLGSNDTQLLLSGSRVGSISAIPAQVQITGESVSRLGNEK